MAINFNKGILDKTDFSRQGSYLDIATQYFKSMGKTGNRARNAFFAAMFLNNRQAKRESNVIKQLRDLENEQTLLKSRLAVDFANRNKLITDLEEINKNGTLAFYENDAEAAFNKEFKDDAAVFNLTGNRGDAGAFKLEWKQKWADQKKEKDYGIFERSYNPNIKTIEEFSKPTMDYLIAKERSITRPENVSVVHNLFNKVPLLRSDVDYDYSKLDNARKEYNTKVQTYLVPPKDASKIIVKGMEKDKIQSFEIDDSAFNQLIENSPLKYFGSESGPVIQQVYNDWVDSGRTYTTAVIKIESAARSFTQQKEIIELQDAKRKYIKSNPKPKDGDIEALTIWQRGLDSVERRVLGIEDVSQDAIYKATQLYQVAKDQNITNQDLDSFVTKILEQDINKALGNLNPNSTLETYLVGINATFTKDVSSGLYDNAIKTTPLPIELKKEIEINHKDLYKLLETQNFSAPLLRQNATLDQTQEAILFNYQQRAFLMEQNELNVRIGQGIVESIKRINEGGGPLDPKPSDSANSDPLGMNTSVSFDPSSNSL